MHHSIMASIVKLLNKLKQMRTWAQLISILANSIVFAFGKCKYQSKSIVFGQESSSGIRPGKFRNPYRMTQKGKVIVFFVAVATPIIPW